MTEISLAAVRIVLVEPAGGLNVGSVARIMKNLGLQQLVLVNPKCDPLGSEARQMAVHAVDVLEAARRVMTLPEALTGCQRAIATTGLDHTSLPVQLEHPRSALPWLLEANSMGKPVASALIFGREDHGLTKTELNHAQRFVRIPTSLEYGSLNLAQAVAICCYELAVWQAGEQRINACGRGESKGTVAEQPNGSASEELASLDMLEGYYQQLESLLLRIGYLYPHTVDSRMEKFRRLFSRAQLSATEVAMLRGILSQMEWALQNVPF
ncbi:RNA methyltransferase [Leptolyngbya sp. 7M]|uniref:RNA methyltransferase n=1 Tax=Leptolyngbya sp. 7M TaxID=2812896 RepID=UPI001B8D7748|nr:RNA methyltransferase [Leptolyngbya sp. 7M]QYO64660.1 RNA methyltransferase [Leptolyngbya sp. 7M]